MLTRITGTLEPFPVPQAAKSPDQSRSLYSWPCSTSKGAFEARTLWSVRTTRQPLRISTDNAVTLPSNAATRPSPPPSGVRSIWGRFLPSTSQECSIRRPTSCREQHFLGSGDSPGSPADCSWFGVTQVDLFASPETSHCQWFYSLSEACSARMHWHTAGPRACANMHSPSEPTSTDTVQDQRGRGAGPVSGSILAQQGWSWTWFPGTQAQPWPVHSWSDWKCRYKYSLKIDPKAFFYHVTHYTLTVNSSLF